MTSVSIKKKASKGSDFKFFFSVGLMSKDLPVSETGIVQSLYDELDTKKDWSVKTENSEQDRKLASTETRDPEAQEPLTVSDSQQITEHSTLPSIQEQLTELAQEIRKISHKLSLVKAECFNAEN